MLDVIRVLINCVCVCVCVKFLKLALFITLLFILLRYLLHYYYHNYTLSSKIMRLQSEWISDIPNGSFSVTALVVTRDLLPNQNRES